MGEQLVSHLVDQIDLPKDFAQKQFSNLLSQYGQRPETITLEQLREILADHLQNVLVELKEKGECA